MQLSEKLIMNHKWIENLTIVYKNIDDDQLVLNKFVI